MSLLVLDKKNTIGELKSFKIFDKSSDNNLIPVFEYSGNFRDEKRNEDVVYGEATIVSTGANANGQFFTTNFLIKKYKSFKDKPVNLTHEATKIVGSIYDAALFKVDTEKEIDTAELDKNFNENIDVKVKFVLYKSLFPEVVEEIQENIDTTSFISSKYRVSMEIWSSNFGYNFNKDENTFVPLTEETAKLDKKVGLLYKGQYISRQYKDGEFGGMGIVENPAEERAGISDLASLDYNKVILQAASRDITKSGIRTVFKGNKVIFEKDKKKEQVNHNENNNRSNKTMDAEELKKFKADIEEKINSLKVTNKDLDESKAREDILLTEIQNKSKEVSELKTQTENKSTSIEVAAKTEEELKGIIENLQAEKAESDKKFEAKNAEFEEVNKKLAVHDQVKLGEERIKALAEINVIFTDKEKLEAKKVEYAKMDEESFKSVFETLKSLELKKPENMPGDDENNAGDKTGGDINNNGSGNDTASIDEGKGGNLPSKQRDVAGVITGKGVSITDSQSSGKAVFRALTNRTKENPRGL